MVILQGFFCGLLGYVFLIYSPSQVLKNILISCYSFIYNFLLIKYIHTPISSFKVSNPQYHVNGREHLASSWKLKDLILMAVVFRFSMEDEGNTENEN